MEDKSAVEAALFTASAPLSATEIAEITGIDIGVVRYAVKDLRQEYELRDSAIVISAIDGRYRMQLRAEYQKFTGMSAIPEFPTGVMRTLSAIAYNQPVLQSHIIKARGPRGYQDVSTLVDAGYVSSKAKGNSFILTTTKKFSEDFGIGSLNIADIRAWIEANSKGAVKRRKDILAEERARAEAETAASGEAAEEAGGAGESPADSGSDREE